MPTKKPIKLNKNIPLIDTAPTFPAANAYFKTFWFPWVQSVNFFAWRRLAHTFCVSLTYWKTCDSLHLSDITIVSYACSMHKVNKIFYNSVVGLNFRWTACQRNSWRLSLKMARTFQLVKDSWYVWRERYSEITRWVFSTLKQAVATEKFRLLSSLLC